MIYINISYYIYIADFLCQQDDMAKKNTACVSPSYDQFNVETPVVGGLKPPVIGDLERQW